MIVHEKSFATQAVMVFLAVMLTIVSIIGNGSFLAIFARFRVFRRSFTNILIASLAVVDFVHALFNIPLFTIFFVVAPNWLKGRTWAIISSSLQVEFALLNLVSMSVLMLDRFLAVHLGLKYLTWKTTKKAKIAVVLIWTVCTIAVVFFAVSLVNMDLDGVPLALSRKMILEKGKLIAIPLVVLSTTASTVLGILTSVSIHQQKKKRVQLNLSPLAAEARLKMDIKASTTVAMAVATYYICHAPIIVFSIWSHNKEQNVINPWLPFIAVLSTFVSSGLNPIIYVSRSSRNRAAFRQFLKDPCGTSAYQEHPIRNGNAANQRETKPQMEGEEIKDHRDPAASVRPGANPGSDTRPASDKSQHLGTDVAWGKDEGEGGSLDEQDAVARQRSRNGKRNVQDNDVKSSDSLRDRSTKMNAAGRKGTRTFSGVKVRPRSS